MSEFTLFTAFHGNLDFSAIPEADRPDPAELRSTPLTSPAGTPAG